MSDILITGGQGQVGIELATPPEKFVEKGLARGVMLNVSTLPSRLTTIGSATSCIASSCRRRRGYAGIPAAMD